MMEQLLTLNGALPDATPAFFAALLVKSGIIVGVAGCIAFLLRFSSASLRHMVLTVAMASLLILPVALFVLPAWELPIMPQTERSYDEEPVLASEIEESFAVGALSSTDEFSSGFAWTPNGDITITIAPPATPVVPWHIAPPVEPVAPAPPVASVAPAAPILLASTDSSFPLPWKAILFAIWIAGTTILLARLFLAHAGIKLLLRRSTIVNDADWRYDLEKYTTLLDVNRSVRLRVSSLASVPMIIGCRRPMLVLPDGFLDWTEERRRIVLLHELSHAKRHDCMSQYIVETVCALYWFNPMVWLASKQIRIEREIACDDMVIMAGTKASTYAQTILDTIRTIRQEEWSPVASIAMARKEDIEGRLISILDPQVKRKRINRVSGIMTAGLIALLAIPIALAVPVEKELLDQEEPLEEEWAEKEWAEPRVEATEQSNGFSFSVNKNTNSNNDSQWVVSADVNNWTVAAETGWAAESTCCDATEECCEKTDTHSTVLPASIVGSSARLDTLTVKQLIKLKRYGVDANFIDGLVRLGFGEVDTSELIELAKYGADPEYIAELRDAGYTGIDIPEIVQFSKYGVDGDLIYAAKSYGFRSIEADDMIRLSKYGIDGDDLADFSKAGYADLSINELVNLSKYGVDPDEISEFKKAGYDDLSTDDYIALSKYGVDADEIRQLSEAGFTNLSVDDLVKISKYGIDVDDVEDLASIGYSNLSIDELVDLGKYGVDVDDVSALFELGYSNLSTDELISISKYGVDVDDVAVLASIGYSDLPIDDLIQLSKYGTDVEDIAYLSELGYSSLSVDDMIDLGKFGVDIDDVQDLTEAGYKLSVNELIEISRYGVDGSDIAELSAIGYNDLSVDDIVKLSRYGVDAGDISRLSEAGLGKLKVADIIDLSKYDVDPDIVVELSKLGHDNVSIDQLIKMSKYGIDGDYISELRKTGVELSLSEIIELGKHDVDPDFVKSMSKKDKN